MVAQLEVDAFLSAVRTQSVAKGLYALGRFAFGSDCAVVTNGIGFRGAGEKVNLVNGAGDPFGGQFNIRNDHALAGLGIEIIVADTPRGDATWLCQIAGLLHRTGILLKMLDTSFAHLSDRESGGQKTMHHQLVKATFVESFSLAETIRLEACHLIDADIAIDLTAHHEALNSAIIKASKLMGGHGFLMGQVNSLEMFSLSMFSQLSQIESLPMRRDAA